jgi:hypothetical protein
MNAGKHLIWHSADSAVPTAQSVFHQTGQRAPDQLSQGNLAEKYDRFFYTFREG